MSNDLISRKTLMEEIDSLYMSITGLRAGKGVILKFMEEYKKSVLKCVDEAPTAYDVDAVCEELSKRADESREYWQKYDDEQAFGEIEAYCESIMVVRNGGEKSENKNP